MLTTGAVEKRVTCIIRCSGLADRYQKEVGSSLMGGLGVRERDIEKAKL